MSALKYQTRFNSISLEAGYFPSKATSSIELQSELDRSNCRLLLLKLSSS
jgi:hypothetical protein